MISQSFDLQYKKRGVFMIFTREKPDNRKPTPLDYAVGDQVIILAGDFADQVGTVKGHYAENLILELGNDQLIPTAYTNVIKWLG